MTYPVNRWAGAIAERLSDEWDGKSEFPEDAELYSLLSHLHVDHKVLLLV